ncbi:MAG: 23S rRNA (adenine(2503)-C(2))-methyltransferase RlmN [Candidatus Eisenbacteria bacterium]|uniref:Probable dual-specificity RNA methyltransferase RlmN n=1 Tax=Eiseniibacteriota bacterium TaxID=2212470 RepID=A0A538U6T3_UNCEI|nr:MAG: 23S rRNA (adenine(2503)-C(2))-methyltransferase RlmN [Candidatus Eisenbacteria bacterium]
MFVTLSSSSSPPLRPRLYGLTRASLETALADQGYPRYRADQIFSWIYQKHLRSPGDMRNLPGALREGMAEFYDLELPEVAAAHASRDHLTHKFVLALRDGARVESVSMRTERRMTFCLSSQVGCALGCTFCATGLMGLQRNLGAHEIVAQVLRMGDFHAWEDPRFNLVFMGMGEPLANYDAVVAAIRILHDPRGLNLGARRITVSTSGVVPGIRRLAEEGLQAGLALSLHATRDELRDRLVPINKRWPIAEVVAAARDYGERTGRRVTLEYTLLAGVNDGAEDARRLAELARSLPSKINLIAYNPVPGLSWKRPSREAVDAFAHRLLPIAPAVTVRHTMGGEIWAACGQLGGLTPEA